MHILYLHQYFVPPDGKGGTRSYEIARRFVKEGHKVTLITSNAFFPDNYICQKHVNCMALEGIELRVLRVPYSNNFSFRKRIWAFLLFALNSINESLKVKKVDIVFATSTPLTIAFPGVFAKKGHKCPMIFEVRDLWPEMPIAVGALRNPATKWAARWLEKWAYRNADHIIALSPGMRDGIVRTGFQLPKVTIISNSCDIELFKVPASEGDNFIEKHPYLKGSALVTYAGTMGIVNGVEYLVEIAAHMLHIDPSVKFLIAGDGKQKKTVIERANQLGVLENNLWIIPPIAKKDMPKLLAATTVGVSLFIDLPVMWNNSANKFFDTLAASRPVMINYEGWQADVLRKNGAGIVVSPKDSKAAAAELNTLLKDGMRIEKARSAAELLSQTEFNRDKLFTKLMAVFNRISNEKNYEEII